MKRNHLMLVRQLSSIAERACLTRCLSLALLMLAGPALGQEYQANWYTIDGGAGVSTGSVYSVTATIGQPDAGLMSGGLYTVAGGFWAAVNAPVPQLSATWSNTAVVISWPKWDARWRLAYATDLKAAWPSGWTLIPPPYETNSTHCRVSETVPAGNKFYRLHMP